MLLKKHHLLSIGKLRLENGNPSCQGRSIKFPKNGKVKIQKERRDRVRGISWEYIRVDCSYAKNSEKGMSEPACQSHHEKWPSNVWSARSVITTEPLYLRFPTQPL